MAASRVSLVCLDIDGTLTDGVGGPAIQGAAEAIRALRRSLPVRLVTNATSRSHRQLCDFLRRADLLDDPDDLVIPATTARRVLTERGDDHGLLLVDDAAREDFTWFREAAGKAGAVLLGTEAHGLRIADLQPAFRALLDGARLYALQTNRFFRRAGDLVTDLGPVAAFLEYASERPAENLGKPSRLVFQSLADELGVPLAEMAMVGDDAEFDVSGAVSLGMTGILVRTGKFRPGDERRAEAAPAAVLDSVAALPGWLGLV